MGETEIEVPRDRQASFESIISATIDDIYGFKLSAEQISKITNYVLDEQESWQNRTLAPFIIFWAFVSSFGA